MGRNWAQGGVHWCGGGTGGAVSVFADFGLVVGWGGGGRYRCLVDSLVNPPANV